MKLLQRFKSIRFVLTGWYTLILLAAFALFGFSVYIYLQHLQDAELSSNLMEETDWISRLVDVERGRMGAVQHLDSLSADVEERILEHFTLNPRNYVVILSSLGGDILYESEFGDTLLPTPSSLPPGRTVLTSFTGSRGINWRLASQRADPFMIQVAYTEETTEKVLHHLLSIFLVIAPVVLVFAVGGGWLMATVALRPIVDVTQRANRITVERLNERIPARPVPDEIGALIATMNDMIGRLQISFRKMKELFVSIAHELKTPLTIMKGEAEFALTSGLTPENAEQLVVSYLEEIARISRIVDDLLTIARADAGQLSIDHQPVDISLLLQDLYDDASILASDKHITVSYAPGVPAVVSGDASRLRQLFRALLTNAIQYTNEGGSVGITCLCDRHTLEISVRDTGIGIPRDDLQNIFEPFYRSQDARDRVKSGSGLGLSVARRIAEAHNGSIRVESTPGAGSCFTVRLPLQTGITPKR